jgi:TetR/AcrR family transcriptional regulator, transcriptional repressor for nem operon
MDPSSKRAVRKKKTREKILSSATRLIHAKGLAGASVDRVMRGAGLTVGGFYAHFRSKRMLDAAALCEAIARMRRGWFAGLEDRSGTNWLAPAVKRYLSTAHRDSTGGGCPLPAVLSELTRADKGTRDVMAQSLESAAQAFAAHAPETPGIDSRERALATLALCVGGLTIARALGDTRASDELLHACVKWALPELQTSDQPRGVK